MTLDISLGIASTFLVMFYIISFAFLQYYLHAIFPLEFRCVSEDGLAGSEEIESKQLFFTIF